MKSLRQVASQARQQSKRVLYRVLPDSTLNWLLLHKMPRSGQVEATTACNLDCPLCFTHGVPRGSKMLRSEHVESVVDACKGRLKHVCFHLQGEPLLNKDLFRFIRLCNESGIETSIGTNGMLIDKYVDEIIDSGLSYVSVAIDGTDKETHERYRLRGDFDRTIENTRKLIKRRDEKGSSTPKVEVQTIMFSYNEERENDVVDFLEGFGADAVALKCPSYAFDIDEARRLNLDLPYEKFTRRAEKFLASVDPGPHRKYERPDLGDSPRLLRNQRICPHLERAFVLSDGRVVACCMDAVGQTTFGNLNDSDFETIWRSDAHRDVIQRFFDRTLEVCKFCNLTAGP